MSIIRTNSRKYLVELMITLVMAGSIIFGVTYKLYGEAQRLKAITAENQIRRMTKTAYYVSGDFERKEKLHETHVN